MKHPKFIQIAISEAIDSQGSIKATTIIGLDEDGDIWEHYMRYPGNHTGSKWHRMERAGD